MKKRYFIRGLIGLLFCFMNSASFADTAEEAQAEAVIEKPPGIESFLGPDIWANVEPELRLEYPLSRRLIPLPALLLLVGLALSYWMGRRQK